MAADRNGVAFAGIQHRHVRDLRCAAGHRDQGGERVRGRQAVQRHQVGFGEMPRAIHRQ